MKRLIYVLVPALLLGGLIAWRIKAKKSEQAAQAQAVQARKNAAPDVTVAPAVVRDIVHVFEGVGSVEAPYNVKIASQVTGLLTYLQLREGDHVTAGEVVARIDPSSIEAQVAQQQANLAEAQQRLTQAELTANPTNVQVTTNILQQQAVLASSVANANQTQQNYNATVAAAKGAVTDAEGRVDNAKAAINNANAAIASAKANLANAQTRYNRTNGLYKQGFVAAQDVDDARTQVQVYQSAVTQQQAQLASAQAALASANAEKQSAADQLSIVITKGKADILAAQAVVNQSRAALAFARSNTAQRPAYQANLAALRATVKAAQAQLNNARAQLAYTVLRSSVSGYVTARTMDPGTVATAGQQILSIEAVQEVFVTTTIPEDISRKVYVGQPAQMSFDALPARTFVGKITQVNPAADPQSRQFMVRVTLDNRQHLLKAGMFGRVTIETEHDRNQTVVPLEAVTNGKTGPTVAVVDAKDVVHRIPVQTGPRDTTGIAILKGLEAGAQVITLSQQPVKDGQKVRIGTLLPPANGAPAVVTGAGGAPFVNATGATATAGAATGAAGGAPAPANGLGTSSGPTTVSPGPTISPSPGGGAPGILPGGANGSSTAASTPGSSPLSAPPSVLNPNVVQPIAPYNGSASPASGAGVGGAGAGSGSGG
jgi:RND family efflux transporter MFP subunit